MGHLGKIHGASVSRGFKSRRDHLWKDDSITHDLNLCLHSGQVSSFSRINVACRIELKNRANTVIAANVIRLDLRLIIVSFFILFCCLCLEINSWLAHFADLDASDQCRTVNEWLITHINALVFKYRGDTPDPIRKALPIWKEAYRRKRCWRQAIDAKRPAFNDCKFSTVTHQGTI